MLISIHLFSQKGKADFDSGKGKLVIDTTIQHFKDSFILKPSKSVGQDIQVFIKDNEKKDTWFKDVLPIFTLLLGIFLNRLIEFFINRKTIKKQGERWITELRILEDPIKAQIGYLQEFKKEHDLEKFDIPLLTILSILNGESFNSLDRSELIKYFVTIKHKKYNDAITLSTRINIFISILKNHFQNLKTKFDEYLEKYSEHTLDLTKNLQVFLQRFREYDIQLQKQLNGNPIDNPRYRPLFDLINTQIYPHIKSGHYDIYVLEKDFIIPAIDFFNKYRLEDWTNPLIDPLVGSINNIKGIKMAKYYFSQNLEVLINRYSGESIQLNDILDEINKLK